MSAADDRDTLVLNCNKTAMDYLREDDFKEALALLKKAEALLNSLEEGENAQKRLKLLGITYNNFGCFYKRKKQPNVALYYLQKALSIESTQGEDQVNVAGTHLNICAIHSQLSKHSEALHHAYEAYKLVEGVTAQPQSPTRTNAVTTLIIAFHNIAVELEFLGQVQEAVGFYEKGLAAAVLELGREHGLTRSLQDCKAAALERLHNLRSLTEGRKLRRDQARVPVRAEVSLLLSPDRTERSKSTSKVTSAKKRVHHLPAIQRKINTSLQLDDKLRLNQEFRSFQSYGVLKESSNSREARRQLLEEGIGSTRRHFAPVEKLRMYLTPALTPVLP